MRFLVYHSVPRGATKADIEKLQKASQQDPDITGYRSFMNLTEGKAVCLFDAPDRRRLVDWLAKNRMEYDSIVEVELEGFRGQWVDTTTHVEIGL